MCDVIFNPIRDDKDIASMDEKAAMKQQLERNSLRLREFDGFEYLMYDPKSLSDVKIIVEGETVNAHKCILAKSSPVFLEDIKLDVFMTMLRYMYAGQICLPSTPSSATDLMERLKTVCGRAMCETLSVANAVECLKIADRYQVEVFKAKAVEFILSHAADFVNKPEFKLLTEVPDVLFQVCRALWGTRKVNR
ncbi:speckle-type POZ protein-like [Nasonia vitripennis]|uniref:BTB domain-containing protein n=1 Tax=Nasonia vitripennis TaxID=7425 RepID=A0A7M7HBU2_NASVI|nr:speckle-type POZ protein-like [Nasonia vitripennis]